MAIPPQSNDKQYYSILQWIVERNILSEKGEPFDFYERPWLLDILTDWNKDIVITACAQVGKSLTFTVKVAYAIKHLKFHVIYTMPTDDDVREFVAAKVNKFIQSNRHEFEGMDSDSIERKEMQGRFWFFKGTISKTAAISTTADILVHDELSRSDQNAIGTYKSRTKASKYKGRWLFSNPGVERDELDMQWIKSDQKEWMITCTGCKDEHFLSWPESVDIDNKCYVCRACKNPISDEVRLNGRWIAQNPGSEISGYHISHLMCVWISAKEVIEDSTGDPQYFNNFVLGKPYSPGDLSVNKGTILDIWTPRPLDTGNYFLGVDVGNIKHYEIRSEKGTIKVGRFTDWKELDDIIAFYKPKAGVIDAMPDNFMAKYYVQKHPWMMMSFFQENNNNPQTIVWYGENDKKGIIYSHRDRILDQMLNEMIEAAHLIGCEPNKELQLFIKHFETLRREKVINNKGIERYVWGSTTGEDHFVFAHLYAYLAVLSWTAGSGAFFPEVGKSDLPSVIDADNKYDVTRMFVESNNDTE